jgi:hypothetical protein
VTPFTAGPLDPVSKFPTWVVDSNGVGLTTCLDSVNGLGVAPPCIYTPVVPSDPYSVLIGRGVEAFYYLANSKFTTPGANTMDVVIVLGMESAFTTPTPINGSQTQFARTRIRINVSHTGIYTVEYPWGTKTYTVDTLLKAGNGQNRDEISDVFDAVFNPGPNPGSLTPFVKWDPATLPAAPAGYLGDGITLHTVTGALCGNNFVRITATDLSGVPLNIDPNNDDGDNDSHTYTNPLFTVQGKLAPTTSTPLAVGSAYYTRDPALTMSVFANAAPTASLTADGTAMASDNSGRFYVSIPIATGIPPTSTVITAVDLASPSTPNIQTVPVTDLVTITKAEAICTAVAPAPKLCTLTVQAESSDLTGAPVLRLDHYNLPIVGGLITVPNLLSLPGAVSVSSSALGVATKPVTVINQ